MFNRCESLNNSCVSSPIYATTYLVAFAAGTIFGLYRASQGNKNSLGIESRSIAFANGELSTKAIMLAELYLMAPKALELAESYQTVEGASFGDLVVSFWAFRLGSDLAQWAYRKVKLENEVENEAENNDK